MTSHSQRTGDPIPPLIERLSGVKRTSSGWIAKCPAHDDGTASLTIAAGREGKAVLHCQAGCETVDVLGAIGLQLRDLFPAESDTAPRSSSKKREIVCEYPYVDENGALLFHVVRFIPKDFRQRAANGSWKLNGVRRVLYHLPQLVAAIAEGRTVYIVEGEKDVHSLESINVTATTCPGGAEKWRAEYGDALAGADVVILPDNDEPGRKHARTIATALQDVARSIRVVTLPGLPKKGDVTDWINAGGTPARLEQLTREATPLTSSKPANNMTDLGNARRIVAKHGPDLRYIGGSWWIWDGRRFTPDKTGEAMRRAKTLPSILLHEAADSSDALRKELTMWALRSESETRLRAALSLAQSEPGVSATYEDLDATHTRLNVMNGTIDLETGKLHGHDRIALMTKLAPVHFDPSAQCPRWVAFLDRTFDGNKDLIAFVQRALGYSLTGLTDEQVLLLLIGTGANGKSTLLETMRALLGDYCQQADFSSFMVQRQQGGIRNDIARLRGSRFVTAVEAEEGQRLAESVVKSLTGGDMISARFLYQESFEFRPAFKLWLSSNHKPRITGQDHAIWRRIRLIPFNVTIPVEERDPHLLAKLRNELPGILAWCVQGCLSWRKDGLGNAPSVEAATAEYRAESDILGAFLEEHTVADRKAHTPSAAIYARYKSWAEGSGEYVMSQTAFGTKLKDRGFPAVKVGASRTSHRTGLRLREGGEGLREFPGNFPMNPAHDANSMTHPLQPSHPALLEDDLFGGNES